MPKNRCLFVCKGSWARGSHSCSGIQRAIAIPSAHDVDLAGDGGDAGVDPLHCDRSPQVVGQSAAKGPRLGRGVQGGGAPLVKDATGKGNYGTVNPNRTLRASAHLVEGALRRGRPRARSV